MNSFSKAGWHLPFALLTVSFLLYVSLGLWFSEWLTVSQARPAHALDSILSPETIDALFEDARLHNAILELTETVALASLTYGDSLESGGLKDFGKSLSAEVARIKAGNGPSPIKRQLFGGGKQDGGFLSGLADLFGGGGKGGNATSLGDLFKQGLSGIGDSIVGSLATPAYFLGIGLGMGAEDGLNLTTPDQSKAIATKIAAASGEQPTGVNLIAQNLGSGLTAQLAPSLANLSTGSIPIGMVAFSLAQGIGQGSASGLNLTQQTFPPTNGSDIMTIAKNLGLGITGPIASSLGMQKILSQAGGSSDIMKQIPQIAAAAGAGLGQGASKGLGLTKSGANGAVARRQAALDPTQMDIPGIVGNLTQGLSQSFLESSNLTMLLQSSGTSSFKLDSSAIVSLASGAGKGIGEGVALGLGGNSSTAATQIASGGNQTEEQIAEQFTKNLVTSLIQNGGVKAIGDSLSSQAGGLTTNVDMAKAAEGAARGLVEGSISAMSEAGGLQKVIKGDFPRELATNLPSLPQTKFNDSLNGSVVAFMRGLSGEGVLLVSQMLNMGKNSSAGAPPAKRSIDASGVVPYHRLSRRADAVTPAIDDKTLQGIAQTGVDTITCGGLGGVAALALGVLQGPALKGKKDLTAGTPLDNSTLAALPKGPVTISHEGNKFTVNIAEQAVSINGLELKPFAIMTALHVVFCTLAFFFALPAYLAMGAIWRFSDMIGVPINDAKMKKWRMIVLFGFFTPFAFIGIFLGIAGKGSAAHFKTAHSIFGLIALLFIIPAVFASFMRLRTTVGIPPPSAFLFKNQLSAFKGPHKIHIIANMLIQQVLMFGMISWVQGFDDLRSISLCIIDAILTAPILVGLLNVVLFVQIGATGLLFARFILERRIALKGGSSSPDAAYAEKGGKPRTKRSDTIQTFGFDSGPVPDPTARPPLVERRTADLLGKEDSKIGWPVETRKLGDQDPHPGTRIPSMSSNPFADPTPRQPVTSQQSQYNPNLPESERRSLFPPPRPTNAITTEYYNNPAPGELRPSSEIDPQSRFVSYAPPPGDTQNLGGGAPGPTVKRYESFSRPLKTPKTPTELGWNRDLVGKEEMPPRGNPYAYG